MLAGDATEGGERGVSNDLYQRGNDVFQVFWLQGAIYLPSTFDGDCDENWGSSLFLFLICLFTDVAAQTALFSLYRWPKRDGHRLVRLYSSFLCPVYTIPECIEVKIRYAS